MHILRRPEVVTAIVVLLSPPWRRVEAMDMAGLPAPRVQEVRQEIYMVTFGGINTVVASGTEGTIVIDPGPAEAANTLLGEIRKLSSAPIRYLIATSADQALIGGTEILSKAGYATEEGSLGRAAPTIATKNVLTQMLSETGQKYSRFSLPDETFSRAQFNMVLNSQPIEIIAEPGAHSAGDSAVRFPRADVVITGAIFDDTRFPIIDYKHGGSIQGEFDALNELVNREVITPVPLVGTAVATGYTGTLVVPMRGPLCDQADLVTYRDMIGTVMQRVQDLIDQHKTLAQVKAADPAQGYRTRWGSDTGDWTTDDFIEAVYNSLVTAKGPRRP